MESETFEENKTEEKLSNKKDTNLLNQNDQIDLNKKETILLQQTTTDKKISDENVQQDTSTSKVQNKSQIETTSKAESNTEKIEAFDNSNVFSKLQKQNSIELTTVMSNLTLNTETLQQLSDNQISLNLEDLKDRGRESFQPWPNSSSPLNCRKLLNHFAKPGSFLPTVSLASYPGSGNTWLRYLIEGATGFFTRGPDPIVSYY